MEPFHPLRVFLQLQLASDSYAVLHLPYILSCLTPECFLPSTHLPKWIARVNSLLHSKDPGARWAGLCLALKTSTLSKSTMLDCAQSWLGVALPMISKNESLPCLKASVRLLRHIFVAATDIPEFQRQLATPNVPKFSLALVGLADKYEDQEMRILVLNTLTELLPLYPTLHRPLQSKLSSLANCLSIGSAPSHTSDALLESASRLYAVMHFTGGKVGASNLWRNSVDETLALAWNAFLALRSTFRNEGKEQSSLETCLLIFEVDSDAAISQPHATTEDPLVSFPFQLHRIRCCTTRLEHLLRSSTIRPVQIPIGSLSNLTNVLLSCIERDQIHGHVDTTVRVMEISVIPMLWKFGCDLLTSLAKCIRHHLTPNLPKIISVITYHLEQKLLAPQRLIFLETVQVVLTHCHPLNSPLTPVRLVKAILPSLTVALAARPDSQRSSPSGNVNRNRKVKKKARSFEGDEVFKVSREVVFATADDGNVALAALAALQLVGRNAQLSPGIHSISCRVMLSMLLALHQMSPSSLSPDPTLHGRISGKVLELCTELGVGTTSDISKSLGLVIGAATIDGSESALSSSYDAHRRFDLLLHPRVPPVIRSLPNVELLSLFREEESQEETNARKSMCLGVYDQAPQSSGQYAELASDGHMEVESAQSSNPVMPEAVQLQPAIPQLNPSPAAFIESSIHPPTTSMSALLKENPSIPISQAPLKAAALPKAELGPMVVTAPANEDDEDIPSINMDSDSD